MFGTLLGALPAPTDADASPLVGDAAIEAAIEAQLDAGLEPLTDGRLRTPDLVALAEGLNGVRPGTGLRDGWRFVAERTDRVVKQAVPGAYTLARRIGPGASDTPASVRREITIAFADAINREIRALADAGCPLVEIEERDAPAIGEDDVERALFAEAQMRTLEGLDGIHCSLSIVGGNADAAGIGTILAAPYASLAVDLIAGPDNWRLVAATPSDRGIVCGALSPTAPVDDGPELLVYAAAYAASTQGRGRVRVGLGTAGDLLGRTWPEAVALLGQLGRGARLSEGPVSGAAPELDPRAVDIRSAAFGRYMPRDRRGRPPRGGSSG